MDWSSDVCSSVLVGNLPTCSLCPAVVPVRCSVRFWPQDLWRRFSSFVSYRGEDRRAAASGAGSTRKSAIVPALVATGLAIGTAVQVAASAQPHAGERGVPVSIFTASAASLVMVAAAFSGVRWLLEGPTAPPWQTASPYPPPLTRPLHHP